MASTLTVGTAINQMGLAAPKLLSDGYAARYANEALNRMWFAYPWRESIVTLTPFAMIAGTPDYVAAVPANFYAIYDAWLAHATSDPTPLRYVRDLRPGRSQDRPTEISYVPETGAFRLEPTPADMTGWTVAGRYKKLPAVITNANMVSYIVPWQDIYFEVFRQSLLWKVKKDLLKDPTWADEYKLFRGMLDDMANAEGLHSGAVFVSPESDLSLGG